MLSAICFILDRSKILSSGDGLTWSRFSPEIFEGVVAFSGVVKLGSITNVTQSAT